MTVQLVRNPTPSPADSCPNCRELPGDKAPNVSWWGHRSAQDTTQIIHDVCLPCLKNLAHASNALSKCSLCQKKYEAFPTEAYQISLWERTGRFLLHNTKKIEAFTSLLFLTVLAMAVLENTEEAPPAIVGATALVAVALAGAAGAAGAAAAVEAVEEAAATVKAAVAAATGSAAVAAVGSTALAGAVLAVADVGETVGGTVGAALVLAAVAATATATVGTLICAIDFIQPIINRAVTNLGQHLTDSSEAPEAPLSREETSQGMAQIREHARDFRAEAVARINQTESLAS